MAVKKFKINGQLIDVKTREEICLAPFSLRKRRKQMDSSVYFLKKLTMFIIIIVLCITCGSANEPVKMRTMVEKGPPRDNSDNFLFLSYDHPSHIVFSTDRWFLGQDDIGSVPHWSSYISGTDLGVSVKYGNETYFYMGDTSSGNLYHGNCCGDCYCNDVIVRLDPQDQDPTDGIDVLPCLKFDNGGWKVIPISIPGIHTDPWDSDFWGQGEEPVFTVPSGAGVVWAPYTFTLWPSFIIIDVYIPTVALWYTTACCPEIVDNPAPGKSPRSWVGCSLDGVNFYNCYGVGTPFSADADGAPARFISVSPVPITRDEMEAMYITSTAQGNANAGILSRPEVYDPQHPEGGILLFGSGRFYRHSGLYLAFIKTSEFGIVSGGKPLVHYLAKDGQGDWIWSPNEYDARCILPECESWALKQCDNTLKRQVCSFNIFLEMSFWNWSLPEDIFGEFSVKLIREGGTLTLVMLSQHLYADRIQYRTAALANPTAWSEPEPANTNGYGPYIIEEFTNYDAENQSLELWHVVSHWKGGISNGIPFPDYGVYTNSIVISPWPPPSQPFPEFTGLPQSPIPGFFWPVWNIDPPPFELFYDEIYENRLSLGADVEFPLNRNFSLLLMGGYHSYKSMSGADLRMIDASLNGKFYLGRGFVRFFVNGGGGYYWFSPGENDFGFNLGGGLQLRLGKHLALELGYNLHNVFKPGRDMRFSFLRTGIKIH